MSLNAAGSSTYLVTSCRKANQFWNVYVSKNLGWWTMPKDISQKDCHTPRSETLRLRFSL